MQNEKTETVNHPCHYNNGTIEVIDIIEDHKLNFCEGNALKYLLRYKHKNPDKSKQIEDLKKSIWYIERLIKNLSE